ncbi:MAG: sulfatase-like hydrolase/transferase [Lentisphaeria bacterium]|nr:sulfatase-like hydrolase/transferase [Lentisphaeria bacterium]
MKKPNILIFMTEHQRFDTVLPDHPCITPVAEKLAKEGLRFDHHYTPMAHCSPSRASFFTGLYPSEHGVYNNVLGGQAFQHGLNPGIKLWNEDLIDNGYRCALAGKWHVSAEEWPRDRGWKELDDNMEERLSQNISATGQRDVWNRVINLPYSANGLNNPGTITCEGYQNHQLYQTDDNSHSCQRDCITVEAASKQLEIYLEQEDPWCLFVGTAGAHTPYKVPQKYIDLYPLEDVELPKNYYDDLKDKPNYYRKLRSCTFDQLSEQEVRDAMRHYWAMCTFCDEKFGELLQQLDASEQANDTIVIYTGDHGDYAGDHGFFHKGVPSFDSGYHVPMIMRWPAGIQNPGRIVTDFTDHTDFAKTFTVAANINSNTNYSGQSLIQFCQEKDDNEKRKEVYFQCNGTENYFTARGIKTADFKYVYNGYDYDELYDLNNDPDELINLQAQPEFQIVKKELMQKIWEFAYEHKDSLGTSSYIMFQTAPVGPISAFKGEGN